MPAQPQQPLLGRRTAYKVQETKALAVFQRLVVETYTAPVSEAPLLPQEPSDRVALLQGLVATGSALPHSPLPPQALRLTRLVALGAPSHHSSSNSHSNSSR